MGIANIMLSAWLRDQVRRMVEQTGTTEQQVLHDAIKIGLNANEDAINDERRKEDWLKRSGYESVMPDHKWGTPPDGNIFFQGGHIRIDVCEYGCGAARKLLFLGEQMDGQIIHCTPNPIPNECHPNDDHFDHGDWIVPKPQDEIARRLGMNRKDD